MKTNHKSRLLARVIAVLIIFSMVLPWNSLLAVGVENRGAEGITVHQDGTPVIIAANGTPIIVKVIGHWDVKIYEDKTPLGVLGSEDMQVNLAGTQGVTGNLTAGFQLPRSSAVVGGSFNKPYSGNTKVTMVGDDYTQVLSLVGGGYTSTTATTNADVVGNTDVTVDITGSGTNIKVYGGGFAKAASADIKRDTKVTLENGKIGGISSPIHGGGYATSGNANVEGNTHVFVNGGTIEGNVGGGGFAYAMTGKSNVFGEASITIKGGKFNATTQIFGGGKGESRSGIATSTAQVKNTNIKILGGDFTLPAGTTLGTSSIISGGGAGYRSKVLGNSYIYIGKGKFQRNIAAGGASLGGTVTGTTTVEVAGGTIPKLINGNIGTGGTDALDNLYISGGTIINNETGAEPKQSAINPSAVNRTEVSLETLGGVPAVDQEITSVTTSAGSYGSGDLYTDTSGKIYMYLLAGVSVTKAVTKTGDEYKGSVTSGKAGSLLLGGYTQITDLGLTSKTVYTWSSLKLGISITPDDATFRTVKWSIKEDGGTHASLSGGVLSAKESGSVTLTATVENGMSLGQSFTKDFEIKVIKEDNPLVHGGISFDNNRFFANGNPTLIKEGTDGLNFYYDFGTVGEFNDEDMWIDLGIQEGANEESGFTFVTPPSVYGGGKNINVSNTSVTLLSGKISTLYGGGLAYFENNNEARTATVTGTTDIKIFDGSINKVYGGGDSYRGASLDPYDATVQDTKITLSGGTIKEVYGGGNGNEFGATAMVKGKATICIEGGDFPETNISLAGNSASGEQNIADITNGTLIIKGGYLGGMIDMAAHNGWVKGNTVLDVRGGTIDGLIKESNKGTKDRKVYISGGSLLTQPNADSSSYFDVKNAVRSAEDSTPVYWTGITLEEGIDVKVDQLTQDSRNKYGLNDVKTNSSGKIGVYLPSGTKTTAAKAGEQLYLNTGGITTVSEVIGTNGTLSKFIAVTGVNLESTIYSGILTTLKGTVSPSNASISKIIWEIKDGGNAEVVLKTNTILAESVGPVTLEATVPMGLGESDYIQEIPITIKAKVLEIIEPETIVGLYSGAPKTAEGLGLPQKLLVKTEGKNVKIPVSWNVTQCDYDPDKKETQKFSVGGKLDFTHVINDNQLSQDINIDVILNMPLTDESSGIVVGGQITPDASLVVTDILDEPSMYEELLMELGQGGIALGAYELTLENGTLEGEAEVKFPVKDEYNNKVIEIIQQKKDGTIVKHTRVAKDGYVSIRTGELSTFLIGLSGENKIAASNANELEDAINSIGADLGTIVLNGNINLESNGNVDDTLNIIEGGNIIFIDDGNPRILSINRTSASQCAIQVEPGSELEFNSSGKNRLTVRIDGEKAVNEDDTDKHTIGNQGKLSFSGVDLQIPDKYHHSIHSTGELYLNECDVSGEDLSETLQYVGGGIFLEGKESHTEVNHSTFSGFARGPAILAVDVDSLKINQTTMSDCGYTGMDINTGQAFQGALVIKGGNTLRITGSQFKENKAIHGGAVKISDVSDAIVSDSLFEKNIAFVRGGALHFDGKTTAQLENIDILECKASGTQGAGGGFFASGDANILMDGGKISTCSATEDGGGMMITDKACVTLTNDAEIYKNQAKSGGGINVLGDSENVERLVLESAIISENRATSYGGGGVFISDDTKFRLDNAVIRNNKVTSNKVDDSYGVGGGIWVCPQGSFAGFAFSGLAIYNNESNRGGSDMMVNSTAMQRNINISPYMVGGGNHQWQKEESAGVSTPVDDSYYQNRDLAAGESIYLKSSPSAEDITAAERVAKVFIEKNTAVNNGGGLTINGPTSSGYDKKITVHKTWAGDKNPKQPTSVSVQLYRNGAAFGNPVVLSESTSWTHSWDNIDANSTWTVEEVSKLPEGYLTPVYQGQGTEEITIINTFKDKVVEPVDPTMYRITKSWEGGENPDQPKSISVQRYKNGVPFGEPIQLGAGSNWTYSWEDTELTSKWTVKETSKLPEGYMKPVYIGQETQDIRIVNTYKGEETPTETITRKVVKKWAGDTNPNQPDKVKVQLYKDGKPFGWAKTLNKSNKWTYTWEGLEKGHRWTVDEIEVPKGYKKSLKVKGNLTTIYNTYTKPTEPISPVKPSKPNSPGTGDNLQLGLYVVIVLGSIMTLIAIALRRKTK